MRPLALLLLAGCSNEQSFSDLYGKFSAAPAQLDFGAVVANEESRTLDLVIENSGPVTLTLEQIGPPDDPAFTIDAPPTLEIPRDEYVTIPVTFTPSALGDFVAALPFVTDDLDLPTVSVPLLGTGRVPYAPDIAIVPAGGVDFGAVAVGGTGQGFFEVVNEGDADLLIGSVVQSGAGTFALQRDFSGTRLAPADRLAVFLTYAPVQPDGDSGALSIPSNDPDEALVNVSFLANGGGTFDYPIAAIDCPGAVDVAGATEIVLDGSASFDPLGGSLTYAWSVVRRPIGADPGAEVNPADQPIGLLVLGAAGTWEVSLVVTSDAGVPSVPAKCVIDAVPVDQIHVELAWSGPTSDMDLHLADEDALFYSVPGDVSWCNPNPDWGVSGESDDDPELLLDDADGYGPEQIAIAVPATGAYSVRVHFFDDGDDGDTTGTVSVFASGTLVWSGSKVLARNEVWDVGQVNWPDGTFGVGTTEPADAGGTRECD